MASYIVDFDECGGAVQRSHSLDGKVISRTVFPSKSAYAMRNLMTPALAMEAEKVCAAWGIGRFAFAKEPGIFKFDLFEEPDWERLAEMAGEPVDMQAWQAWARERGKSLANVT
jgi:hypothetical protein